MWRVWPTFPEFDVSVFERNEDDPSDGFIMISSPRCPHFKQNLFINKWNSLLGHFIQPMLLH
jgi:hypothetical protein